MRWIGILSSAQDQDDECIIKMRQAACLMSTIKCGSLKKLTSVCNSVRHLILDHCKTDQVGPAIDVLFSSSTRDTQCIDENFKFHLNAPKTGLSLLKRKFFIKS